MDAENSALAESSAGRLLESRFDSMKDLNYYLSMLNQMIVLFLVSAPALAADTSCKQVIDACETAGFTQRDAKNGRGLYLNCVNLIMQGAKQPEHATLSLPILNESVVLDCKTKHPKFGQNFKK